MKTLISITLVLCFCMSGFAQKRIPISRELTQRSKLISHKPMADPYGSANKQDFVPVIPMKQSNLLGNETEIIETYFDPVTLAADVYFIIKQKFIRK